MMVINSIWNVDKLETEKLKQKEKFIISQHHNSIIFVIRNEMLSEHQKKGEKKS